MANPTIMESGPHTLVVDPHSRMQWGSEILLVFGEPREDGGRDGALLRPQYCTDKRCECGDVKFHVTKIDESVEQVIEYEDHDELVTKGAPKPAAPSEQDTLKLSIELRVGKIASITLPENGLDAGSDAGPDADPDADDAASDAKDDDETSEGEPSEEGWREAFNEVAAPLYERGISFGAEALDELWSRLKRAKGLDPTRLKRHPPDDYEFGAVLAWEEVCLNARRDAFMCPDGVISAVDFYCPAPLCDCNEAHVSFTNASGRLGAVVVQLQTGVLRFDGVAGVKNKTLQDGWDAYVERRPDYLSLLQGRYQEVRRALHNVLRRRSNTLTTSENPVRREGPKIGRNQPCPCGSGRKHKRCCG